VLQSIILLPSIEKKHTDYSLIFIMHIQKIACWIIVAGEWKYLDIEKMQYEYTCNYK
jgi:hypothetical protein